MNGFQLTFYTQQDHRHAGKPLAEWLMHLAAELQLRGATLIPASEGLDREHRLHAARFFELTDQPLSVVMVVDEPECERLFERLRAERVDLFYVKSPVEFGRLGD
jgi:uncharacterized protein